MWISLLVYTNSQYFLRFVFETRLRKHGGGDIGGRGEWSWFMRKRISKGEWRFHGTLQLNCQLSLPNLFKPNKKPWSNSICHGDGQKLVWTGSIKFYSEIARNDHWCLRSETSKIRRYQWLWNHCVGWHEVLQFFKLTRTSRMNFSIYISATSPTNRTIHSPETPSAKMKKRIRTWYSLHHILNNADAIPW